MQSTDIIDPLSSPSVQTEKLRAKLRTYASNNRTNKRDAATDSLRFGLGDIQQKVAEFEHLTVKDVVALAARIKRRKHATTDDMFRLSHAFLQGVEYILAFVKIPGALQILVKELTGTKFDQQISSCETLCNLSIGNQQVCEKIASVAGSYLITYLSSNDIRLKKTSLWVISNILNTGIKSKGAAILIAMEVFAKLIAIYFNKSEDQDIVEDAAKALCFFTADTLRSADKALFLDKLIEKDPQSYAAEYHMKIVFGLRLICPNCILNNEQVNYLIGFALSFLLPRQTVLLPPNFIMAILYSFRVLSNLLAVHPNSSEMLFVKLEEMKIPIVNILNSLFSYNIQPISMEGMRFLKIILHSEVQDWKPEIILKQIKVTKL